MSSQSEGFQAIRPGLRGRARLVVTDQHTALHLGSGGVRVLATPQLVLLMEQASVAAVEPVLPGGLGTVGAHLDVRHLAPTPVGFEVLASAELTNVEGRQLTFRVQVYDQLPGQAGEQAQLVGEGTHLRILIDVQRFEERVALKIRPG